MQYIFGFAGLPAEVYCKLAKRLEKQVINHSAIIGRAHLACQLGYDEKDIHYFFQEFARFLSQDAKRSAPTRSADCLIYRTLEQQSTIWFAEAFFPELLVVPVSFFLDALTPTARRAQANIAIKEILTQVEMAKNVLKILEKELRERANRTPLLLPIKNFKSDVLACALFSLNQNLVAAVPAGQALNAFKSTFMHVHPEYTDPKASIKGRARYVDDRGIHFVPPGKGRHGFLRSQNGHPPKCLLSSHLRLGAPYHPAFHYDCIRGAGKLVGNFFGCHTTAKRYVGSPHLNIATNDFVR